MGCFLGGKRNRKRKKGAPINQVAFDLEEDDFDNDSLAHIVEYDPLCIYNLEITFFGYAVAKSPFEFLREYDVGCLRSTELSLHVGKTAKVISYVSTSKRTSARRGDAMLKLNLSDECGMMDVVIWPEQYKRFYTILTTSEALQITGKASESFGVTTLEVKDIRRLECKSGEYRVNPAGDLRRIEKEILKNVEPEL